jgi:hypothetical protein
MSNELTYHVQTRLANGSLADVYAPRSLRVDQSVARLVRHVQELGVTAEALVTGDVITPGISVFLNLDTTGYLEVGSFITTGLPGASKLIIDATGAVYIENASTGLHHEMQVDGPDGSAYHEIDPTGSSPVSAGFPSNSKIRIDGSGDIFMENVTTGLWHQIQIDGADGSAYFEINPTGASPSFATGLPANSRLQVDASGDVFMQNVTTTLYHQIQADGADGSAYFETNPTGQSVTPGAGTFSPFVKLKAGEYALFRLGVGAGQVYARASAATGYLFYIIYND